MATISPVIQSIGAPTFDNTQDQTRTACTGRRMDRGIVGPQPKRTTRSGRWFPKPSTEANFGRIDPTSTGWFRKVASQEVALDGD
jgi:hypothetical protein